jgi:ankyrin repeat protein
MCCVSLHRTLLFCLLSLASCGRPVDPKPVISNPANAAGFEPAASGGQQTPLAVRLELEPYRAGPTFFYDRPVKVVLTNKSAQSVRVWNPRSKNGYGEFSFQFMNMKSGQNSIVRMRDDLDRDSLNDLFQQIKPGAEVIEIPAGGETSFEFVLSSFAAGKRAWVGLPTPNTEDFYAVSARLSSRPGPDATSQKAWTGDAESPPTQACFFAVGIVDFPHAYLEHGFWERAIEMMEADPKSIATRFGDCTPLHYAAKFGPPEAVQWLLDHGADVNALADNGRTPLNYADDPAIVRLILAKQPDLSLHDSQGKTPPQSAASELADARDDKSRDHWRQIVNLYKDVPGGNDLFIAATLGQLDRFKEILTQSPKLADDLEGRSPLRIAAARGHLKICQYLLENYRVDVNDFERGVGYPIIKESLAYPQIVRLLIENGADLKTRITWRGGRTGMWIIRDDATALHYAADIGVPETINLLVDNGVDIFATAHDLFDKNDKQTALEVAAFFGKAENAQAIVNHPKFGLAEPQKRQTILDKCLRIGAPPSWLARDADRPKLIEVLLQKGANPNTSENGVTPIQLAAREIHPTQEDENEEIKRTIDALTRHGAKMDLFTAVAIGDEEQVQKLLASDRQLANVRGPDGYPALHFAVSMNYKNIVSALLTAGGDVNIRNESENTGTVGDTALDWADFWDRDEIAKLLVESGGKRRAD